MEVLILLTSGALFDEAFDVFAQTLLEETSGDSMYGLCDTQVAAQRGCMVFK